MVMKEIIEHAFWSKLLELCGEGIGLTPAATAYLDEALVPFTFGNDVKGAEEFAKSFGKTYQEIGSLVATFKDNPRIRPEHQITVFIECYQRLEKMSQAYDKMFGIAQKKPTCKKGCAHCCTIPVALFGPEIDYIKSLADENHLKRAARATNESDTDTFGKQSYTERMCPFNKNGLCTIYETRPISCRKWAVHSDPLECRDYENQVGVVVNIFAEVFVSQAAAQLDRKFMREALSELRVPNV